MTDDQISPVSDQLGALTRLLDEAWPAPHWDIARKILDAGYVLRGHAQTAQQWQPIETASDDFGTQVWGWDEKRGSNPMILCESGWRITYDDALIQPTHWQPMPTAPSDTSTAYNPEFVKEILAADAAPPEATITNISELDSSPERAGK